MTLFYIIMILLSLVGIIEIISYIIYHIMSVKNECSTMLITPVDKDSNYEMIIRSAIEKTKWMGHLRPKRIIIVTENLSDETIEDMREMTYGYSFIEIYNKKDMNKVLTLL
ncbi:MAG: hypothetical protein J1F17_02805 [Oscillospiraceae bacterium]|nr:hypothetical protein [Oscillospiraceae bacterium]